MRKVKYKIIVVAEGTEEGYLEIKKLIESGEFQRQSKQDQDIGSIKATIEKLNK